MDEMPSSEFRRRYASLTQPVRVTVLGRPIGEWTPILIRLDIGNGNTADVTLATMTATKRAVLDLYDAERFNSRPFTPAPKKGK